MKTTSLTRTAENVDGVPCEVIDETVAEVSETGAVLKVVGRNRRFEFLERWKLRHLVKPREMRRVVLSEVPKKGSEGGDSKVFFVTVEGTKNPEKVDGKEEDALKQARQLVHDLFFGR